MKETFVETQLLRRTSNLDYIEIFEWDNDDVAMLRRLDDCKKRRENYENFSDSRNSIEKFVSWSFFYFRLFCLKT